MLERAGKYIFRLLVVAVPPTRALYLPISQPVASNQNQIQQAKTGIAR
jgi:hypothetical protein